MTAPTSREELNRMAAEHLRNWGAGWRDGSQAMLVAFAEKLLAGPAQRPVNPTQEDIYACCRSTLIGFRDELTERNIEFICDQISRKSTWKDDGLNEDGSAISSTQCAAPAPHAEAREAAIAECAKVADIHAFSARQAVRHATGPKLRQRALAVEDAALLIVKSIRALALPQAPERDAQVSRPVRLPIGEAE